MFNQKIRQALTGPGAPSQSEIARRVGISAAHLSNLLTGRSAGSERVRRSIADELGLSYEAMIGADLRLSLLDLVLPRFSCSDIGDLPPGLPDHYYDLSLAAVPVVPLSAALDHAIRALSDILDWVVLVGLMRPHLVAIHTPPGSVGLTDEVAGAHPETLLIVDISDPACRLPIREGALYLCGPPCVSPVQRLFTEGEGVIITTGGAGSTARPHILAGADLGAVRGRVVGECPRLEVGGLSRGRSREGGKDV